MRISKLKPVTFLRIPWRYKWKLFLKNSSRIRYEEDNFIMSWRSFMIHKTTCSLRKWLSKRKRNQNSPLICKTSSPSSVIYTQFLPTRTRLIMNYCDIYDNASLERCLEKSIFFSTTSTQVESKNRWKKVDLYHVWYHTHDGGTIHTVVPYRTTSWLRVEWKEQKWKKDEHQDFSFLWRCWSSWGHK